MKNVNGVGFVNDEAIIGMWENVGWTEDCGSCSADGLREKSGEFGIMYCLPEGEPYWIFEGWTKGTVFIHYGGDEPLLSYSYELRENNGELYLFLRMEDRTEVFVKRDSVRYTRETLGRHDSIDLPFVNDKRLIGKWKSAACIDRIEDFVPGEEYEGLYLERIEVLPGGSMVQKYMDDEWQDRWTKGHILSVHRSTDAAYVIKEIDGTEYLFMEWKMGNYIYGGMEPQYYVFRRVQEAE